MPGGLTWLDLALVVVLILFLAAGYRRGFWVTLGTMTGLIAGAAGAFFAIPLVSSWVEDVAWRWVAIIIVALLLIGLGQAMGAGIGRWIRLRLSLPALRTVDRIGGAVANTAVAAGLIGLLAFSASSMGVPSVSLALAESRVIRTIDSWVPDDARALAARVRSEVAGATSLPIQQEAVEPEQVEQDAPTAEPTPTAEQGDALEAAGQAVLRISGTAVECGQNQTGSGFAVAPDRVVTNAHVVAGLAEQVVEGQDGSVHVGRVVHFDPDLDLAVIAVDGADLPVLGTDGELTDGEQGVILGYPAGGPFSQDPAEVQARGPVQVTSIYGGDVLSVDVYQLHADVQQGGSGGPLLTPEGEVAGVVFARSAADVAVGYAITADAAREVFDDARDFEETVSTGQCIQGG